MMRGRDLKPLKLPHLVEARKREGNDVIMSSPASTGHGYQLSRSSTISDLPSPTTPGSATRHSKLPSSASSLPSSPVLRESLEVFGTGKRPLTDVKEEPLERDDDYDMIDAVPVQKSLSYNPSPRTSIPEWTYDDPRDHHFLEYDLADESDPHSNPVAKRQRAEASTFDGFAAKISAIKPSLSRKWKSRRVSPTIALPGVSREHSLSRANSTRAPSFSSVTMESTKTYPHQLPPTPTRSALDESFEEHYNPFYEDSNNPIETEDLDVGEDQAKPTTPLLPPLMTSVIPDHIKDVPYQSPLQSPSVADPDTISAYHSPQPTPQISSLPSPPLSSRPSVASFHRHHSQRGRAGPSHTNTPQIIPSSEIPPHPLDTPQDDWADTLGHANFHIVPEPYCPTHPSASACEGLRQDWHMAREAFRMHLEQVGEHYGPTSKTFLLTEEKWSTIDAIWKRNVEACAAAEAISGGDGTDYEHMAASIATLDNPKDGGAVTDSAVFNKADNTILPISGAMDSSVHSFSSLPTAAAKTNAEIPSASSRRPSASPPTISPTHSASQQIIQTNQRPIPLPKVPAKFPSPGENGIVGPMEVVASRRALEAHLDRAEAAGGDWASPSSARGQGTGTGKRKRKWGGVFNFQWMMERFRGDSAMKTAKV